MKFSTVFLTVAAALATVSALQPGTAPAADDSSVDVSARDFDHPLTKRACTASSCLCNGVPGLFCGDHSINPNCNNNDVYQCNSDGHTCNFGARDSCAQCHELSC